MRRLGILGLAFLAVLALGSAASASASAAKCEKKVGSKHYIVCVNGEKLGSTSSELLMTSTIKPSSKVKLGFFTGYVPVVCTGENLGTSGGSGVPTLKNGGTGSAVLTGSFNFSSCSIEAESEASKRCTTSKTMEWKRMTGSFGSSGATTLHPENGSYGSYQVHGENCPASLNGIFPITGSPECTLTNMETETLSKELLCTGTKSYFLQSNWGNVTFKSESIIETLGPTKKPFSVVEG